MLRVLLNVSEMSSYLLANLLILLHFLAGLIKMFPALFGYGRQWCRSQQRKPLRETIKAYRNGEFDKDRTGSDAKVKELWWDWFCKDSSLGNKGRTGNGRAIFAPK